MLRPLLIFLSLLAQPAQAFDFAVLEQQTAHLNGTEPQGLVRSATARCLMFTRDRARLVSDLNAAGWDGGGDDEWIEMSRHDIWVTLLGSDKDYSCDVDSGLSQAHAFDIVVSILENAQWDGWSWQRDSQGCNQLNYNDKILIFVTSGGQDPVCTETGGSAIRITWPTR